MNFASAKVIVGYATASIGALVASVKLACALGPDLVFALNGNFFG
jgi:hypothetical protein